MTNTIVLQSVRTCTVENCARGGKIVRGCCTVHYQRLWLSGRTELLPIASAAERLASRLIERPNGCREWTGAHQPSGYGHMQFNGKLVGTHRVAWVLANGPIPDGLHVCHSCDNPPCCNPAHLWLGTNVQNDADRDAKGRRPCGSQTFQAKLTETDIPRIRAMRATGMTQQAIANAFGVSRRAVCFVLLGKTWRHVPKNAAEITN